MRRFVVLDGVADVGMERMGGKLRVVWRAWLAEQVLRKSANMKLAEDQEDSPSDDSDEQ